LIRKRPTKAFEKEKEELRAMRAVFKKGEWDQRRTSLIERKDLFATGEFIWDEKTLSKKEDLRPKTKLLKGSG